PMGAFLPDKPDGVRPALPRARAEDGGTRIWRRRDHRFRSRKTTGTGFHGLRIVQGRSALSHQGAGETVRAAGAGEHRLAWTHLVQDVDAARGDRRSTRAALRPRPRRVSPTIPRGSAAA